MSRKQIVAIVLVKNEDLFIKTVLENILVFCDRVHVADHRSTDKTPQIIKELASEHPWIEYRCVDHVSESHDMIADYAGTDTWVMGVDGDEVYDPQGLKRFRKEIFSGQYDRYFKILGNVLNIQRLDRQGHSAWGYLTPPCRSMTKLYNFAAIDAWPPPCPERLHGGTVHFRDGFNDGVACHIFQERTWEESPFRCLHFCFQSRSSLDKTGRDQNVAIRKGPGERNLWAYNIKSFILSRLSLKKDIPYYKKNFYMRGPIVEKDISVFGLSCEKRVSLRET
jgi:glycosyltransferase involved in cell wall biosynthesis